MKRISILSLFAALLAISYVSANDNPVVSGQGKMKFKVLYRSDHLPAEAQKALKGAHGGFSVDMGKGKGMQGKGKGLWLCPIKREKRWAREKARGDSRAKACRAIATLVRTTMICCFYFVLPDKKNQTYIRLVTVIAM